MKGRVAVDVALAGDGVHVLQWIACRGDCAVEPVDLPYLVQNVLVHLKHARMSGLTTNGVRLAPNGTNLGLFKISFS